MIKPRALTLYKFKCLTETSMEKRVLASGIAFWERPREKDSKSTTELKVIFTTYLLIVFYYIAQLARTIATSHYHPVSDAQVVL